MNASSSKFMRPGVFSRGGEPAPAFISHKTAEKAGGRVSTKPHCVTLPDSSRLVSTLAHSRNSAKLQASSQRPGGRKFASSNSFLLKNRKVPDHCSGNAYCPPLKPNVSYNTGTLSDFSWAA